MNTAQTPRARILRGTDEPERQERIPALVGMNRVQWRIENAKLIGFGLWLSFLVGILAAIDEMNGW